MRRRIFLLLTVLLLGGLCGCSPKAEQEGLGNGWQPEQSSSWSTPRSLRWTFMQGV